MEIRPDQQLPGLQERKQVMENKDLENRFSFHPATTEEIKQAHETIRNTVLRFAVDLNDQLPEGREKSLAITKLEEVMFWANAAIARQK